MSDVDELVNSLVCNHCGNSDWERQPDTFENQQSTENVTAYVYACQNCQTSDDKPTPIGILREEDGQMTLTRRFRSDENEKRVREWKYK